MKLSDLYKEGVSKREINLCVACQFPEDFVEVVMFLLDEALKFNNLQSSLETPTKRWRW